MTTPTPAQADEKALAAGLTALRKQIGGAELDDLRPAIVAYLAALRPEGEAVAWTVESLAQWLHDETEHQESYPHHHWPEHPDDDGNRDVGFIKIVPVHAQAYFRQMAARCLGIRPFTGEYFRAIGASPASPPAPAVRIAQDCAQWLELLLAETGWKEPEGEQHIAASIARAKALLPPSPEAQTGSTPARAEAVREIMTHSDWLRACAAWCPDHADHLNDAADHLEDVERELERLTASTTAEALPSQTSGEEAGAWDTNHEGYRAIFNAALTGICANPNFFSALFQQSPQAAVEFANECVMATIKSNGGRA